MRVVSFGIYSDRPEYPRQRNLVAALRAAGAVVTECNLPMAGGFRERFLAATRWGRRLTYLLRMSASYPALFRRYRQLPAHDVLLLGYPGVFHAHLARWLTRRRHPRPVFVFDIFLSLYDTVVHDRQLVPSHSPQARLLYHLERTAVATADRCLIDTPEHGRYLQHLFRVSCDKILSVPVGPTFATAEEPTEARPDPGPLRVFFAGTYIPLHGVDTILGAARHLRNSDIRFTLVGNGQQRAAAESKARTERLDNVTFQDWLAEDRLRDSLRSADVGLGIFGDTAKAQRVVPIKVYDICAAGVPLVTADTQASRSCFRDGDNALLIPPADARALADALLRLRADPELRGRLAVGAHRAAWDAATAGRDLLAALKRDFPGPVSR